MSISGRINNTFFHSYNDSDIFIKSSARLLFILSAIFFILMFLLFFVNARTFGYFKSFLTSGTSCISASVTIFLIMKGRLKAAGTVMSLVQFCIILMGTTTRASDMTMVTLAFFVFPTILLAVVFSTSTVHVPLIICSIAFILYNLLRFDPEKVINSVAGIHKLVVSGTAGFIVTILLTYILGFIAMRSLKLALKVSNDETLKSMNQNELISKLLKMVTSSYSELTDSIDKTDQAVSDILLNLQTEAATIEELVASIEEISSSTTGIEKTTGEQNISVSRLSSSIRALSDLIDKLQVYGSNMQEEFAGITSMATQGNQSSRELEEVNLKTLDNSNNIQSIANIIDDFFDRINLLSLNAAIEAARAGDHGRGFAVVADEISKLADNSSSELKKIKDLVDRNRSDVEHSSTIIGRIINFIESLNSSLLSIKNSAADTLQIISKQQDVQGEMLAGTDEVNVKSDFIRNSSSEQSVAIQEIAKSIEETNSIVQKNANNAEVLKSSYNRLRQLADNLKNMMSEQYSVK